jgi:hypothetical protein
MKLHRFSLSMILTTATLFTLTTSQVIAQESRFFGERAKPDCIQDALPNEDVSPEKNLKNSRFHCGREEYTTQPPFR